MCVPLVVTGILLTCFSFYSAGGSLTDLTGDPTKRVKLRADIWPDQQDVPAILLNGMRLSPEPQRLGTSCCCSHARDAVTLSLRPRLTSLAPSPFEGPEAPVVSYLSYLLRNWYPRPARGTAVKSVRISISVCTLWNHRDPFVLFEQGATGVPEERWPTKTSSKTRENVPYLLFSLWIAFHGGSCGSVTNRNSRFVL